MAEGLLMLPQHLQQIDRYHESVLSSRLDGADPRQDAYRHPGVLVHRVDQLVIIGSKFIVFVAGITGGPGELLTDNFDHLSISRCGRSDIVPCAKACEDKDGKHDGRDDGSGRSS